MNSRYDVSSVDAVRISIDHTQEALGEEQSPKDVFVDVEVEASSLEMPPPLV